MTWNADWAGRGACRSVDPDSLFVQGAAQNRVKGLCMRCEVRTECLADALDNRVEFGVWGGMTERERRALLRRRPNVTSWQRLLEQARSDYEQGLEGDAEISGTGIGGTGIGADTGAGTTGTGRVLPLAM